MSFLGEISDDDFSRLTLRLGAAELDIPAFRIVISGIGFFPEKGKTVRVVYADISDGGSICREIHDRVAAICASLFPTVSTRFVPHLTVGRVKKALDPAIRERAKGVDFQHEYVCNGLFVYESILGPTGARYVERYRQDFPR